MSPHLVVFCDQPKFSEKYIPFFTYFILSFEGTYLSSCKYLQDTVTRVFLFLIVVTFA